jgi:hypothetical protein
MAESMYTQASPNTHVNKKKKTKFYSYRLCLRIQILQLITFLATLQIMYSFLGILSTDFDYMSTMSHHLHFYLGLSLSINEVQLKI